MELLNAAFIGLMFAIGVFQLLRRNVIRSAIGLLILANAVNLFLLSTGAYVGIESAYVSETLGTKSDALPQALILTAIVISLGGTAFVMSILYIISARYKTSDSDEVDGLKH
jgi:multicomponent Na+:H+ antiporter subunit C